MPRAAVLDLRRRAVGELLPAQARKRPTPKDSRFPGALSVSAVLAGVALLAGREAAGSASRAPPFLSVQSCVVVIALIPARSRWQRATSCSDVESAPGSVNRERPSRRYYYVM